MKKCCNECLGSKHAFEGEIKEKFGGICGLTCECHNSPASMKHTIQEEVKGFPENRQPTCSHYLTKEGGCPCDCHRSLARKDEISCYRCIPYIQEENWKKEFDDIHGEFGEYSGHAVRGMVDKERVKKFISTLLASQLQSILEEVEGMKNKKEEYYNRIKFDMSQKHNIMATAGEIEALSDVQSIISNRMGEKI